MDNISDFEKCFNQFWHNLKISFPDGVIDINLKLLMEFGLLDLEPQESEEKRIFHVIETNEKVTLINQDYVIWITPRIENSIPVTYTLIAKNDPKNLIPEICFKAKGSYNSSHVVLSLVEKYLDEIQENQAILNELKTHF